MRMLAGIDKPDEGILDTNVKISYKPQYLNQEMEGDVRSLIYSVNGGPFEGTLVEEHVFSPLGLKNFMINQ